MSLKDRARAILQGNHQGNFEETKNSQVGNFEETSTPKSLLSKAQQQSSDWRWFCDSHERTLPDGRCEVKHDRLDPMTDCVGWQLKSGRVIH
jgi:hypothetical protein